MEMRVSLYGTVRDLGKLSSVLSMDMKCFLTRDSSQVPLFIRDAASVLTSLVPASRGALGGSSQLCQLTLLVQIHYFPVVCYR